MIEVVTFDADGTLWDFERVMREALGLALAELQSRTLGRADALTVADLVAIREAVASEPGMAGATHERIRLAAFERTLDRIGLADPDLAARLNDLYMRHRFAGIRPFDDVVPALDALAHLRLGMVSNGSSYPERCGLPDRFAFAVFAHEHGGRKPDRRVFEAAVRLAGCRPDAILHAGDSLEADVAGAQRLGIRAAWINRTGRPNETRIVPDVELDSLAGLPALCLGEIDVRASRSGP